VGKGKSKRYELVFYLSSTQLPIFDGGERRRKKKKVTGPTILRLRREGREMGRSTCHYTFNYLSWRWKKGWKGKKDEQKRGGEERRKKGGTSFFPIHYYC